MGAHARTHRLFFALWPSDELRAQLGGAAGSILARADARPIPAENLHITLAFLGAVPMHRLPDVMAAAQEVEGSPMRLMLSRIEAWRGADILCLTPAPSAALRGLVERLRVKLLAHEIEPDQKEFRPHVTLARDWRDRGADSELGPIEWRADDFVLVESETTRSGSAYRVISRWPLRGASTG